MPKGFYTGSGHLKLLREGDPDIKLVPGSVVDLDDDVLARPDVARLDAVCGYDDADREMPCARPVSDGGRCADHSEGD